MVRNGGFAAGQDGRPSDWESEQWSSTAGTNFEWRGGGDDLGVGIVKNPQPNDARWAQSIAVQPNSWYRLSGFLARSASPRISSVRPLDHGGFTSSRPIKGKDSGWQPVSLWFKTGIDQRSVRIACRLGNFRADHRGRGLVHGHLVRAAAPPAAQRRLRVRADRGIDHSVGLPAAVAIGLLLVMALARYGRLPADVPTREWLRLDGILIAILAVKMICAAYFSTKSTSGATPRGR